MYKCRYIPGNCFNNNNFNGEICKHVRSYICNSKYECVVICVSSLFFVMLRRDYFFINQFVVTFFQ